MRVPVEMPKVNFEMESGTIAAWRCTVGDQVEAGQILADIETEKAVVELGSPAAGSVAEIVHQAGAEVPVKTPIAWLETGDPADR